tara:strand:- start:3378 stop:3959 length:582 start_codon:yes stop_codon:yes gene_type:complete
MSDTKVMNPTGHLQIFKLYEDGREELYFDDQNVITSGMGVGFSHLFSASGASSIVDYQIINFLVGSGGNYDDYGVSTYKLELPVQEADHWGSDSQIITETLTPIESGVLAGATYPFARIRFSNVHKVTNTSVRYTLVIDRSTLNTKYINEIGLYMRNPRGLSTPSPILVAYRPFTTITKTSDFSLIFRWTLQF